MPAQVTPPVEPMLAKVAAAIPDGDGWAYEPKWDGFRAIAFRDEGTVFLQSRDLKPLDRYFPEVHDALVRGLPDGCVVDGEIVIATPSGLDFDALQMRLHPAASRVERLARETPASFVAFDLLAEAGDDLRSAPTSTRRARLERLAATFVPPLHLTPHTHEHATAVDWLARFEGAGLDGVIARRLDAPYSAGARTMIKIKHVRTADCVVAGFRWHKAGPGELVGSLLLGLFDEAGTLQHVGVTSAFTMAVRRQLAADLAPLRVGALDDHPWRHWATAASGSSRMPGASSRWSAGKDLSWEPLRPERVCEVAYDHLQGDRFRHAATFRRWRPDKPPAACRYDQLEVTTPYELARVFTARGR
ncbi:ATP-dependent DNA ligase [Luteitalea sp. TBR-22]|uniref:ATP-dependent DNA ligase n=1 Tax=Luteitalea sp. TBR-22 TaxID=2802971 RepID=UPI001AF6BAC0|nr:ATP-dependent DNA ligase [Luteitalea sp. TBR-22]BCS31866.1 ATP-dependent DNA ligase [Luteitalea sp. TBR-22]